MADEEQQTTRQRRTFKKFTYRGVEVGPPQHKRGKGQGPRLSRRTALLTPTWLAGMHSHRTQLSNLLDLSNEQFMELVHARARRRFQRGLTRKPMGLIKKLRKAKKEALPNEKPTPIKTHLRNMIIVPEMIGSQLGVYSGKVGCA